MAADDYRKYSLGNKICSFQQHPHTEVRRLEINLKHWIQFWAENTGTSLNSKSNKTDQITDDSHPNGKGKLQQLVKVKKNLAQAEQNQIKTGKMQTV